MNKLRAIVILLIGGTLLIIGLQWRFEDEFSDLEIIEGKITYYNFYTQGRSNKLHGVIHLDTYSSKGKNGQQADKYFDFRHVDAFKKTNFEIAGGGVGANVKLGVKTEDLKDNEHSTVTFFELFYRDKNYIDKDKFIELDKGNNKYMLIIATIFTVMGLIDLFSKQRI